MSHLFAAVLAVGIVFGIGTLLVNGTGLPSQAAVAAAAPASPPNVMTN